MTNDKESAMTTTNESAVGQSARKIAAKGRRTPLPAVTVDKADYDAPTFIRTWSPTTPGITLNEQVCTGEVVLNDGQVGAVARALVDQITYFWDRPDESTRG